MFRIFAFVFLFVLTGGADDYVKSRNKGLLPTMRDWHPTDVFMPSLMQLVQ